MTRPIYTEYENESCTGSAVSSVTKPWLTAITCASRSFLSSRVNDAIECSSYGNSSCPKAYLPIQCLPQSWRERVLSPLVRSRSFQSWQPAPFSQECKSESFVPSSPVRKCMPPSAPLFTLSSSTFVNQADCLSERHPVDHRSSIFGWRRGMLSLSDLVTTLVKRTRGKTTADPKEDSSSFMYRLSGLTLIPAPSL